VNPFEQSGGTGEQVQVHMLCLEGPDAYSRAGGLASRVTGLTEALAEAGFDTHLWYIGDPDLPGHETRRQVHLHRWCQWISRYHPGGVYDGEEGKRWDFASSLPPFLMQEALVPFLREPGRRSLILAEEWQTASAVLHLDWLLRCAGLRHRATIFWNANNLCGFDRIDWARLAEAAVITTVSRYMRHRMWSLGVDPLVIPNGLPPEEFKGTDREAMAEFSRCSRDRVVLGKVARWDPDKRWLLAIDIVGELKRHGWRPLLIARGGVEAHGTEVLARAAAAQLQVVERAQPQPGARGFFESLRDLGDADVVSLRSHLTREPRRVLFRGAAAVLANSGVEPFGLVGLEAMAVEGLACTGGTGEDYAVPGWNALVLQSQDPREFVSSFHRLKTSPAEERALRRRGKLTAKQYAWNEIIRRNLVPCLQLASGSGLGSAESARRRVGPKRARHGEPSFVVRRQSGQA
jgi:glycosyltransferase involved in cell wall biosynthesis